MDVFRNSHREFSFRVTILYTYWVPVDCESVVESKLCCCQWIFLPNNVYSNCVKDSVCTLIVMVKIWVNLCEMTQWMCSFLFKRKKKRRKLLASHLAWTRLPTCDHCLLTHLLRSWMYLHTQIALQGSWDLTCSGVDLSESEKKVSHSFSSIALSHVF